MTSKRLRLLVCPKCQSIEPIEWCAVEPGANPECGHTQCAEALNYRVIPHTVEVADGRVYHSSLILTDVSADEWDRLSTRQQILKNLTRPGDATPVGAELYAVKGNFTADAAKCWKAHKRTTDCQDWKHSSKRLVPDTKGERRELGLETRERQRPTSTFLCDFCPVASIRQTKINSEKFGFNNPY
jgi:hypothetical protein